MVNRRYEQLADLAGLDHHQLVREEARRDREPCLSASNDGRPLRLHAFGETCCGACTAVLADAWKRWRGPVWTFSHRWRSVPIAAWGRISVCASVERIADAAEAVARGYAPALLTPAFADGPKLYAVADGLKVLPCAYQTEAIQCDECRACFDAESLRRKGYAIGFRPAEKGAVEVERLVRRWSEGGPPRRRVPEDSVSGSPQARWR